MTRCLLDSKQPQSTPNFLSWVTEFTEVSGETSSHCLEAVIPCMWR